MSEFTPQSPEFVQEPTIAELFDLTKKILPEYAKEIEQMNLEEGLGFFYTACYENGLDPDEILISNNLIKNE